MFVCLLHYLRIPSIQPTYDTIHYNRSRQYMAYIPTIRMVTVCSFCFICLMHWNLLSHSKENTSIAIEHIYIFLTSVSQTVEH